jgi:hypothetical protein
MFNYFVKKTLLKDSDFAQLYVIQGRFHGRVIPMAFALMERRRKASYRAVFQAVNNKHIDLTGRPLAPAVIVTDFEVLLVI